MKIKSIWDFGRLFLSLCMAGTGFFLIGMLIFHSFGINIKTALGVKIFAAAPFVVGAYFLTRIMFTAFSRLREKCKGEWDFWMIMLSFSLAGMFIMPVRKFIFHLLGITVKTPLWIKVLVYIPIIPPAYYAGLLVFGTLLGQSDFFRGMISKRLKFLAGRVSKTS